MKRQKLEIGEKGEGQSKVLAETRKNQPQSPMWKWPQEGWRPWLLRDQVKEMDGGYRKCRGRKGG